MTEREHELTREELETQDGEPLPPREVMSTIDPDGGLILPPFKPEIISLDDPHPTSDDT